MDAETQAKTAERLLDLARAAGAEAADVIVAAESSTMVGIAGRALEEAERSEAVEFGLRVLIGRRQATVASSDPRDEQLRAMAERAVAIARETPEDPWCGLADPSELAEDRDAGPLELLDPNPAPSPEALEAMARAAEDAALGIEGVTQVEQASASWGSDAITLAATNGFYGRYARSYGGVAVSAIAGEGLGMERDFAADYRCHAGDLPDPAETGARAGRRAVEALGPRRPPGGRVPVLYDERVSASLVGAILAAINGQAITRGSSWLSDKMGAKILPSGLDLWEDPAIPRRRASRPFDAEGLAARRTELVSDGVLASWVLDLATARQLGLASTGHARRGTGGAPRPGTGNVRMTEGVRTRAALLAEMGTGLLVTRLIGSSVNPTTGAYSRGASGFWVEGGEIAYPVNEITIAGSLPDMIARMTPADDADPQKTVSVPSLLVEGLTVGA